MDQPPSSPPPDRTDQDRCKLLGTTGLIVQALMGVFVILSLVAKRQLEKRKRPWKVWMYDVSKQLAGQAVVHGLNILISDVVASVAHNNPCSLYFLNVLIDTTIGVGIIYFSLKAFTWYFSTYMHMEGFISGQYGHPPNPVFWWKQLAPYIMSIIVMKLLVLLPLTLPGISKALINWSHSLLDHLGSQSQVIFVMAIFPLVMNVLQFCLVDQVIKAGGKDDEYNDEHNHADGGGEYRRINGIDDGHFDNGDLESGERPLSRQVSNNRNSISNPIQRKHSASGYKSKNPVIIPSSPLLSSRDNARDYGSATPSPIGSPVNQTRSLSNDINNSNNLWSKLINKVSEVSSSTKSTSSTIFFDAQTDLENGNSSNSSNNNSLSDSHSDASTISANGESKFDRLYVRDERSRGSRSTAPSPETLPFHSPTLSLPSSSSLEGGFHTPLSLEEGQSFKPTLSTSSSSSTMEIQGKSRNPPEDLEREARLTLSPPESPKIDHANSNHRKRVDSVSLKQVSSKQNTNRQSIN
ncbi:uncharacterized protein L201_000941 [Kwoniella dendrophila CBS 6074]|uniref:Vacuolar membrane protein n=1 Tax=Kwoniella dendrophila CBS 6074 TaxID=1295534 RepID=A0AAX4JNF9_9TREE